MVVAFIEGGGGAAFDHIDRPLFMPASYWLGWRRAKLTFPAVLNCQMISPLMPGASVTIFSSACSIAEFFHDFVVFLQRK